MNIYAEQYACRARICKRLLVQESIPRNRFRGIDSEESIPPPYVAWRAGTTNRPVKLGIDPGLRKRFTNTGSVHELFLCRLSQYSAVILSLLMIFFCFIAHWLACIWFVIGFYQDADNKMGKVHFVHF
jgi:hypothetical protein